MAQDNDQTPDQVAAGAYPTPEQRDQGGLVDALRSRGTLPSGLAGMMMPPQVGPNAGLGFGSGVLNAQAGINHYGNVQHSQNPYMDDMYRQSALQARINEGQMEAAQRQMQLQEQMRGREAQQLNLSRQIMKDIIPTLPEGPAKDQMLKTYAGTVSKITGSPLTADFVTALANQNLSKDDINGILDDAANGMNMDLISRRHPGIPPQKIQSLLTADPATLMRIGADKTADRNARLAKNRLEELKAIEAEYPALKGHPEMFGNMLDIYKKATGGLSWQDGTDFDRSMAYEQAKYNALAAAEAEENRKKGQELALYGQKKAIDLRNEMTMLPLKEGMASRLQEQRDIAAEKRQDAKLAADAEKAKNKGLTLTEQKNRQMLVMGEMYVNQLEDYIPILEKKGFLPKDGGIFAKTTAWANRAAAPNDDDLRNFGLLQGKSVGWSRGMEGEIGARFKGAFEQDFGMFSSPMTAEGMRLLVKRMRSELKAIKDDQALMRGEAPTPQSPLNRQIRIRDTKTGKTGTATLAPGEALPAGIEEIK